MARTTRELDNQNTTGVMRTIGPFPVTKALTRAVLIMDRTNFTDVTAQFRLRAEYRVSEQEGWKLWAGFTTDGGRTDEPTKFITSTLPPLGSEVRIAVSTNGKTIRQALSLEEE